MPIAALPAVTQTLLASLKALYGQTKPSARSKRGPDSKLRQYLEPIFELPRAQQRLVSQMLDQC